MNWKFWKRGKDGGDELFYLVFQAKGTRGFGALEKYKTPMTEEQLMPIMTEAGMYMLQRRVKGKIRSYVWKQAYVVEGVKGEILEDDRPPRRKSIAPDSDAVTSAIEDDLMRGMRWLQLPAMIQNVMEKLGGGKGFGGGGGGGGSALQIPDGKTLEEYLDDLEQKRHDRFVAQASRYGYSPDASTSGESFPDYEGKFPIWMHPKGIPLIVGKSMEEIEKRLTKWGLIGEGKDGNDSESIMSFPPKPSTETSSVETRTKDVKVGSEAEDKGDKEEKDAEVESES